MRKMNLVRNLVLLSLLFTTFNGHSQIGIGTSTVNASAKLQVDASNQGFLPPRVSLTSTAASPNVISNPATGLLVYNNVSAGSGATAVTPGFYYFDGSRWQRVINQQPDATIEFNTANPNTGSPTFTPNTPASRDFIYVSTVDNSQWTYNGSNYVTYTPPASTPWYLSSGTNDAGSNKTSSIYRTGRVGIGTNSPSAPFHVSTGVNQTIVYGFLNAGGAVGYNGNNTSVPISIQADQRIRAVEFNAVSDARIKTDVRSLSTDNLLADLNKLKVVSYTYIDKLANGSRSKTGFIAQDVESIQPGFVNQSADFIPSVFSMAESASIEKDMLLISTEKPHGFQKGELIKLFAEGKKEVVVTVEDVKSPTGFYVKGWNESVENLFVYGKKVSDFREVDFDQITALSVAAIQALHQKVDLLSTENNELKKNMVSKKDFELLKSQISELQKKKRNKKRITSYENAP